MRKLILSFVVLFAIAVTVNAQGADEKSFKIGVGAMIGLPVGDASDAANLAYGVDVMGEYGIASSMALTLSAGYVDWSYKSGFSDAGVLPVLAGLKYDFSEKFFGSAQVGLSFFTASGSDGSAFTWAPGVGYKLTEKLDAVIKYQSATKNSFDTSFLGLRIGYTF